MREWNFRLDPIEPESFERERFEKWRTGREGMDRRANVVNKTWQRQLGRACAATDARICFQYQNRQPCARECNRSREAVRSRADHDRVVFISHRTTQ